MSTPLIGGIALTGQPKDFANVAAKRQADAARPKVDKELDAFNKEVQRVLKIDENAHPGLRTEMEDANTEALGRAMRMVSQGDYVGANNVLRDISNRNAATISASKTLYELERVATQGGYNLPEGLPQFLRSKEFDMARGADKVRMFEEFMSDEKNLPYKALFQFGYDERGRPTFGVDMGALKKQDVGRTYGSALQRIKGQVLLDGIGEELQRRNITKGSTQYQQEVRGFVMDVLRDKFWELAADRSFLFNAALRFPEINSENPAERDAAVDRFIEANANVWPQEFRGFIRSAGGAGLRSRQLGRESVAYVDARVSSVGQSFPVNEISVPYAANNVQVNSRGAIIMGEKGQYTTTQKDDDFSKQAVNVGGFSMLPIYTGSKRSFTLPVKDSEGRFGTIELIPGLPIPEEWLDLNSRHIKGGAIEYEWRPFISVETAPGESGTKKLTAYVPANADNVNRVFQATGRTDLIPNWQQNVFPDSYTKLGKRGSIGGGGSSSPAPAPAQRQQTTPAPQGQQQPQAPASGGRTNMSHVEKLRKKLTP